MRVSESVRKARKAAGYSQQGLAAAAGVPQTTISRWENGTTPHTIQNLIAVAEALGVTLDELVGCREMKGGE